MCTLSDEGLAGVQQEVAALYDHPLDGQVLADVLCVADLIVHHPETQTPSSSAPPAPHLPWGAREYKTQGRRLPL